MESRSYVFKWEYPAEEVYVTGTFDDWTKSVKLEKHDSIFQKTVELNDTADKIYYKFVVDNNWRVNDSAPQEADPEGNINNFLTQDQLTISTFAVNILNPITPDSTTAEMAGKKNKKAAQAKKAKEATQAKDNNQVEETVATPTPSDVPGGFPETPANELDQPISVNPLPAAAGAVNPIKLEPDENIPESISAQGLNDNVKLDKESYEKSDTIPGIPTTEIPETFKNTIPESGLPIASNTINTVGPNATTAALAGAVPLEPKTEPKVEVPAVVKESQEKAGVDPEASAVPEEVREKAEVEEELKEKVAKAPATSEGIAGATGEKTEKSGQTIAAAAAATAATAGAAVVAAAVATKDTVVDSSIYAANQTLPDSLKAQLPASAQETLAAQKHEAKPEEPSTEVPTEVKHSIEEAGESPEAAANPVAVEEKKDVEAELLHQVKPVPSVDEAKGKEPVIEQAATVVEPIKTEAPKTETAAAAPTTDAPVIAPVIAPEVAEPPVSKAPILDAPKTSEAAPTTAAPTNGATVTNGAGNGTTATATGPSKPTEAATASPKKKNRFSMLLSKIKHKITDK